MCFHTDRNDKSGDWTNQALGFGGKTSKSWAVWIHFFDRPRMEIMLDKRKADNEIALMWTGEARGHSMQRTRGQLCILVSLVSLSSSVLHCIWRTSADSVLALTVIVVKVTVVLKNNQDRRIIVLTGIDPLHCRVMLLCWLICLLLSVIEMFSQYVPALFCSSMQLHFKCMESFYKRLKIVI